jgi:hypothetical protein
MVRVSGLPAIIIRHDDKAVHVITPIDVRDVLQPNEDTA